jgi:hypothetical protein
MTWRSKLVPIALAITLLVLPMAALSPCFILMPDMRQTVMDTSGMVAGMPPVSIQMEPSSASCCQLSAANAPPVTVPRLPESGVISVVAASNILAINVPSVVNRAEFAGARPPGPGPSRQAVLCVFLI